MDRDAIIQELVANCAEWQGHGDIELLKGLPDGKLVQLHKAYKHNAQAIRVANTAVKGFQDGQGLAYRINPENGQWEYKQTTNAGKGKDNKQVGSKDDRADYTDDESGEFDNANDLTGADANYATDDQDDPKPGDFKKKLAGNKRITLQDVIKNGSPEDRQRAQALLNLEQKQKENLVTRLTANVNVGERRGQQEWLMAQSLDDLQRMASLLPPEPVLEDTPRVSNSRLRPRPAQDDDDMLDMPTINWREKSDSPDVVNRRKQTENGAGNDYPVENDTDEDAYLRNAPRSVREKLTNAARLEARERAALIERLTANIDDEERQQVAINKLSNKSLRELQDMALLVPDEPRRPSNYFGSAAAPSQTVNRFGGDPNEDVLDVPKIDYAALSKELNGRGN